MPPASRVPLFLLVFVVMFLLALLGTVAAEFSDVEWVERTVKIAEGLGRLTFVSIAITFILVEGIPMLAAWYKKQMEEKAREEGRESERQAWQAWREDLRGWERRRAEAEKAGCEFNESPPAAPDEEQEIKV